TDDGRRTADYGLYRLSSSAEFVQDQENEVAILCQLPQHRAAARNYAGNTPQKAVVPLQFAYFRIINPSATITERSRDSAWGKIGSSLRDLFGVYNMLKAIRWWCVGLLALAAMLVALAGSGSAQEKKEKVSYEKHDATSLNESLRDVINAGRKIFNEQGDYAGCYRMFQGSLMTVRPFVAPDLQKKIDQGMANAEKMGRFDDRAFELRRVLDEIRASLKPTGTTGGQKKDLGEVA